jgi:hypothetical protein
VSLFLPIFRSNVNRLRPPQLESRSMQTSYKHCPRAIALMAYGHSHVFYQLSKASSMPGYVFKLS